MKNSSKRISMIVLAVVLGLLLLWALGSKFFISGIEILGYTSLGQKNGYEIRQYNEYIVAEADTASEFNKGMNAGFRVVADYIFGNNSKNGQPEAVAMTTPVIDISETIAMTSPVVDTEVSGKRKLQFVMPSKYTLDSLPTPNNKAVSIRTVPAQKYAAIRYTGLRTKNRVQQKYETLKQLIEADGVGYQDKPVYMYYDPPSTFPWVRRNEVLLPLTD